MELTQIKTLDVKLGGAGVKPEPVYNPRLPFISTPSNIDPVNTFKMPQAIFNDVPNRIGIVSREAAPMEAAPAELTQDEQINQPTNEPSPKIKAMDKLKQFLAANPIRAFLIGIGLGVITTVIICKKFGKKTGWK